MPLNEERALNQLGASAIFEIARANRSKRGLSQAGSSTGGATSGQTFLAAAVANSNAALTLPMLTASEFRCPSSDKNGPAFFTSRPVGLDFPTLVGDPLRAAVVTAVELWQRYMDSTEGKEIRSRRTRALPPPNGQRQTSSEGAPEPMNQLHRARAHTRMHQYGAILMHLRTQNELDNSRRNRPAQQSLRMESQS